MNQDNFENESTLNGTYHPEQEDSGSDRDSSNSVYSMSSGEIEDHFIERHDRRFHSHGNGRPGQYPFPVDDLESQRLDHMHDLVKDLLDGHNYRGPVQQTLAVRADGHRVRILDIGTGNGKWVEEMADEFPHTKVYGLDIVPLATRYPAENVQFEVHDINSTTRWAQGRFDFVHMRQTCFSPVNVTSVIREISRILRPQGLFLACEWIPGIFRMDGSDVTPLTNHSTEILNRLHDFSTHQRLFCNPSSIPVMLIESAAFENVVAERHFVYLDETALGRRAKQSLLDFARASRYYLLDSGIAVSEIGQYLMDLRSGLDNGGEMCLIYLTVYARRKVMLQ
ncbi:hypothetical protein ACEPAF_9174 [Sanghuangporus sanghuang]